MNNWLIFMKKKNQMQLKSRPQRTYFESENPKDLGKLSYFMKYTANPRYAISQIYCHIVILN